MSNTEDNTIANIAFRGIDGNECDAFLAAIREIAYAQGRDEDDRWMLRLATTKLRGNAFRWYTRLDESIRKDWNLFLQALFNRYPSAEGLDETDVATPIWSSTDFSTTHEETLFQASSREQVPEDGLHTARDSGNTSQTRQTSGSLHPAIRSSLSPRIYDASLPGLHTGRLRIVFEEGQTCPQYIWKGNIDHRGRWDPLKIATSNIQESLVVNFYPLSETNEIGWTDLLTMQPRYLGIQLLPSDQNEYHPLIASRSWGRFQDDRDYDHRPVSQDLTHIWNILHDGTLEATLSDYSQYGTQHGPSESYKTTTVFVDTFGSNIYFVKPFTVAKGPSGGIRPTLRAKIVFEPI